MKVLATALAAQTKPPAVVLATWLLWASGVLALLSLIPGVRVGYWENAITHASIEVLLGVVLFLCIFCGITIVFIAKRANWARCLMLLLTAIDAASTFADLPSLLAQVTLGDMADIAIAAANIYAMRLLFFGEGAQWFKAP